MVKELILFVEPGGYRDGQGKYNCNLSGNDKVKYHNCAIDIAAGMTTIGEILH
jgi:hypothetical protein